MVLGEESGKDLPRQEQYQEKKMDIQMGNSDQKMACSTILPDVAHALHHFRQASFRKLTGGFGI